jgi:predicted membrane chloride channel (bestrophin family)
MHTGTSYKLSEFLKWTRRDLYVLMVLGVVPVVAYQIGNIKWLGIPWTVVALLGTATAFIVGFKNLQTYNRTWEARQIWGDIISSSRAWGTMSRDFFDNAEQSKEEGVSELLICYPVWVSERNGSTHAIASHHDHPSTALPILPRDQYRQTWHHA